MVVVVPASGQLPLQQIAGAHASVVTGWGGGAAGSLLDGKSSGTLTR